MSWARRRSGPLIVVAIVVVGLASWIAYFGPDQGPQNWVVVSTGWGRCGTATQQSISWRYCYVHGTFRNDGGTGPNRNLPSKEGTYGDVYAYSVLFRTSSSQTCGAQLDSRTHHWQSVSVECVVAGLNPTTLEPTALDTGEPIQAAVQVEDYFEGVPSA